MTTPFVVAVVATCRREAELARLLASLAKIPSGLGGTVIVDNGGEAAVRQLVESAGCDARYVAPGRNLGCGGGLHAGEAAAIENFGSRPTHIWILDDDAVVPPNAIE